LRSGVHPRIQQMFTILSLRFHEPGLTLEFVACEIGVTPEHLCRLSTRFTGTGFTAHMRRARVAAAQQLLQSTTVSVKEIAFRVGFTSVSHFDRDFKRVCGVPPTVYRRTAAEATSACE
jgi:transcriptional regulator GlxA family with amidase domain